MDLPHNTIYCSLCAKPLSYQDDSVNICDDCNAKPPLFERCITPLQYAGTAAFLIKGLKYHGQLAYGRVLGDILAARLAEESSLFSSTFESAIAPRPECIIPMPLHSNKLKYRGFNQAKEIAQATAKMLRLPIQLNSCIKVKDTPSQVGLTREQRILNVSGAFTVIGTMPSCIAVVDDVITTGSTMNELAKVLKKEGAQYVYAWAIARTNYSKTNV